MFEKLLNSALHNRLMVLVLAAVMLLYGGYTALQLPVDVFPDLNKPTVTLQAEAGGMAPEEVEQRITIPLEIAMSGIPGVEAVRSVSSAGLGFVYVTFDWKTDIFRARQMVGERLSAAREQLPQDVAHVGMGPISSIMGEVMLVALPIDASKTTPMAVREYVDFVLRPRLLTIAGVSQVIPIGGEVRQYQVQPDTVAMAALGVSLEAVAQAVRGFASNTSGGFLELNGREYLIRNVGQTTRLTDLQRVAVGYREGRTVELRQVARVNFAPAIRRGDAGLNGQNAVVVGVQKQPTADTVALTKRIELALSELKAGLPAGVGQPKVTMRQATFIESSVSNLQSKLMLAFAVVAVVLYFFLASLRTTLISLTAIPLSFALTALVFHWLGLSINTMTLGGLTIAIGELVDDAVVGVENMLRRLKEDRAKAKAEQQNTLVLLFNATLEVRSAIVYATVIVGLVLLPLFFLPGVEGRLMQPLAVAYIVSLLASMLVSITVTPVMAYHLLPRMKNLGHGDTRAQAWLKARYAAALAAALATPKRWLAAGMFAVLAAAAAVPLFPTTFLPPFNEGVALVGIRLNPGTTLAESARIASIAEQAIRAVPEVTHVGRRSGRAELDEHAEGVHVSELDVGLREGRPLDAVYADIRAALTALPAAISLGQPISHRIDHMLSGVRSTIAIKLYGDDLDTLRGQADALRERLAAVRGIADLEIEKQVLTPQVRVRVDFDRVRMAGMAPGKLLQELQALTQGERITQIAEGSRRFDLVLRLPEAARGIEGLKALMIDTPSGRLPLSALASVEEADGPNQINRDDGRRRIVLSANAQGRALSEVVADIRAVTSATPLPEGYFITLGGQFEAQAAASRVIGLLSIASVALIFLILFSRYQSAVLAAIIMANIPLALVGAVAALWLSGQPLSVAALVGFITLAGIAIRNGILKVSHYVNLCKFDGERFGDAMLMRGSAERLTPVLMTALVAALAMAPLLLAAEQPGSEILHPVAVVIFGGLIAATLLDSFLTPCMVKLFGQKGVEALAANRDDQAL